MQIQQNDSFFKTQTRQDKGTRVLIWTKYSIPPTPFDQDGTNPISAVSEIFKEDHKETIPSKVQKEVAVLDKNFTTTGHNLLH